MSNWNHYMILYTNAETERWDTTESSGHTWQEAIRRWASQLLADDFLRVYTVVAEQDLSVDRSGLMVIQQCNDLDWWMVKAIQLS